MKRYFITFAYDGTNYKGYQRQPKLKTIQGELEKVLKKINNNKDVEVSASGRTDALVHALNQYAHFDLEVKITEDKLLQALNTYLPKDIYIKRVEEVDMDFHARYMVTGKEYIYVINMGEYNPLERNYAYQYNKKLDIHEIERAMKFLEGEHDFRSFTATDEQSENCVRKIVQTNLTRDLKDINKITLSFVGNGFLKYMIRNIVGTLIEVGEGKRKSEDIIKILESKDRTKAAKTASAEGLYLKNVFY